MISIEDYENMFALFEAEQELISSLLNPNIITEGFNDKVTSYVNKVLQSTQKSWDRFNKKVATEKDKKFLDSNQKLLTSNNIRTFNAYDYTSYDLTLFNKLKVVPFNYDNMKDNLASREKFLSAYYAGVIDSDTKSVKKFIQEKIETKRFTLKCTATNVNTFYRFCKEGFYATKKYIENDLSKLNNTANNINNDINTIVSSQQEAKTFLESMIFEAPVMGINFDKKNQQDSNISTDKSGNTYFKALVLYMKISTEIISTKMKMLSKIYYDYLNILNIASNVKGSEKSTEQQKINQVKI